MDDVPIIGASRTWKGLRFAFEPVVKAPLIASPHTKPEVVGWQLKLAGMRSDDIPFQTATVMDPLKMTADPIGSTLLVIDQMIKRIESFRTCGCLSQAPCALHRMPGRAH